jgi:hypothetical protein
VPTAWPELSRNGPSFDVPTCHVLTISGSAPPQELIDSFVSGRGDQMPNYAMRPLAFLAGRWRVWLPPVIFAIVIFVGAVALSGGKESFSFVYRVF